MGWFNKKKVLGTKLRSKWGGAADQVRVELIRERLSDHISSGRSEFEDATDFVEENEHGDYEFTVTNIARINYDVTEFDDITKVDTDMRLALRRVREDITSYDDEDMTPRNEDYWGNL
jgi:hypothetical protein